MIHFPKILIVLFAIFGINSLAQAQTQIQNTGEWIVRLKDQVDAKRLNGIKGIESTQSIFADLNLWSVKFIAFQEKDAKNALQSSELIQYAHENTLLDWRRVPNDTDYPSQWALRQIGMEKSWDITTGAKAPNGDDIVVAILDDGFQVDHPDYASNIWVNTKELPNNGIDDDGNGFVDDYFGWNATEMNDKHRVLNHGTSVAGIIGATSNNSRQMAGINWNVKMMLLSGGRNDNISLVDIVKAYDYIYRQRKLYNETKGQKGAYVVVSNYSGGVSNKFPKDFPSWCEIYDVLGSQGVLNVGSAPNTNTNIDTEGDLPGTCPSEFLIITTNTNRSDQKVQNAGFGVIGVDIAAPGDDIYTLAVNSASDPDFSGTSAASPHVAGVISLMYSLMCEEFFQQSLDKPSEIALIVKNALLNSIFPVGTLSGQVKSGGRLDALKSLQSIDVRLGDCCNVVLSELIHKIESCTNANDASLVVKATGIDLGDSLLYQLKNDKTDLISSTGIFNRIRNGDYTLKVFDRSDPTCEVSQNINFAISPDLCPFGDFEISALSPNPVQNELIIFYDLDEQKDVQFLIYDMTGRKIYQQRVRPELSGDRQHRVNVSDFPMGIYQISLFSNGKMDTKTFLKLN